MDYILGAELPLPVKVAVAFVVVLVLLTIVAWLFRRIGGAKLGVPAQRGRQPRLAVIDAAAVDGRRRLVLIRRDNVEHLIMIGGPTDVVVEQGIMRAVPVAPTRDAPARDTQTRAPVQAERRPPEPPRPSPTPAQETPPRPARAEPPPRPRVEQPARRATDFERPRAEMPVASRGADLRAPQPPSAQRKPSFDLSDASSPIRPDARQDARQDTSLAGMAQKLEAALRRPAMDRETTTTASMPDLGEPPPPTAPEIENNGAHPAPAPSASTPPTTNAAAVPALAPPHGAPASTAGAKNAPAARSVLDSLEEEMASLLSKPPEKK